MIRGDRIGVNDREEIPIIASTLSNLVGEVGILVATWRSGSIVIIVSEWWC